MLVPPLKNHCGLVTFAFEGVSLPIPLGSVDFDLPDHDDEDPYKSGDDPAESRGHGGDDPTGGVEMATTREEPFDFGAGSIGQKYPIDKYGYRIENPNIWKSLSTKDTLGLSRAANPSDDAAAASSSGMVAMQRCTLVDCERFHDQWVREFESFVFVQRGVDPTEHRPKLESPIFPGACACRLVGRKEVKADQAAETAIQHEWGRLRLRKALG
jgi:hypothetical protein